MTELEASLLAAEIGRNPAPGLSHAEPVPTDVVGIWCVRVWDESGTCRHMFSASEWIRTLRWYRRIVSEKGGTAG